MLPFGAAARRDFLLDAGTRFLNHGSFGATPRAVAAAADAWRLKMEANPDRFMRETLPGELRRAAARLAAFVGARSDDVVFVENATAGANAVLRALEFHPGDQILTTDHVYGAVRQAIRHVCARHGSVPVEAPVPVPLRHADALHTALAERLNSRTKLLIIDHIASPTGLIFPVARLAAAARAAGVRVLVDGAHAPGQIELDVPSLGADWYVGNCHKWLFAPRGSGFLWAHAEAQRGLHPLAISHRYGESMAAEFDWTGTRDFSAWLALPDALEFATSLGAVARTYSHDLVVDRARSIAAAWGTECDGGDFLHAAMIAVRVPERLHASPTRQEAERLQAEWLKKHNAVVAINPHSGALWLRLSAQVYNTPDDYRFLEAL